MTDQSIPYLAPGCFGSALMFQTGSMVCQACPFATECQPVHESNLAAMRERLGIKAPAKTKRVKPVEQSEPEVSDETRMSLPVKVQRLLSKLDSEDFNIVEKMKSGQNPFPAQGSYRFMAVACLMIMKMTTPVTQKVISASLIKAMNWSDGTADAHARMAVQALTHVGAIESNDGLLSVKM